MASDDVSLKDLRQSIRTLIEQVREVTLQLRNIDKRLQNINEHLVDGLTVYHEKIESERMG